MRARRPGRRGVKLHRNYTVDEAARSLGVAKGTVRRWLKGGLPAITDQRPHLILGADLVRHLEGRKRTKQRCEAHQCFCFSCRTPKAPALGIAEFFPLTSTGGNLRALCETCSTVMHKRVPTAKLEQLRAVLDVLMMQAPERLINGSARCLNEHSKAPGQTHGKAPSQK